MVLIPEQGTPSAFHPSASNPARVSAAVPLHRRRAGVAVVGLPAHDPDPWLFAVPVRVVSFADRCARRVVRCGRDVVGVPADAAFIPGGYGGP
jgi:hypothetical protein